jgi:xanthine dehydrogenase small subunit
MPDSSSVRFLRNGKPVVVAGVAPQTTLLEYLRESCALTGTKEGCAEGDCGACTVVIAEIDDTGTLAWKPVNACIRLLPSVDGKAVFTVESLKAPDGTLHPVQQALVDCHASQCGFCTPGFAMSLFGLYKNAWQPDRPAIDDALSGNLCRCTGYRPIVAAAQRMYELPAQTADWRGPGRAADGSRMHSRAEEALAAQLASWRRSQMLVYEAHGRRWFAPRSLAELAATYAAHPAARIVAGATDVGLWITKELRAIGDIIHVGEVAELAAIAATPTHLEIGAGASLSRAFAALDEHWPELHEAWTRFASVPIRNSATLGGNVANGSPIGDSMPALFALRATVVLRLGEDTREMPLEDFYLGYRKTALREAEFVAAIRVPLREDALLLRCYKISKRFDQDISSVFACFALRMTGTRIAAARIGCGGVAATPSRARATEGRLVGEEWNDALAEEAAQILTGEFTPLTDMRASAGYRAAVLGNLLRRFRLETGGADVLTRVEGVAAAP